MAFNFPSNPALNDEYSFGNKTWRWNGSAWQLASSGAINDIPIGNVTANTGNFTALSVQTGVSTDLTPTANVTYDLGTATNRWRDIYLANSTIYLGAANISSSAEGGLTLPSAVSIGAATLDATSGTLSLPATVNIGNSSISESSGTITLPANTAIGGAAVATPRIASIDYPGDDTAADPAGGQTLGIVGSGFQNGAAVILDGATQGVVTFVSATRLEITAPAKATGSYTLYVINPDGGTGIFVPGVQYSGVPTWSSPAAGSLGSVYETGTVSETFVANSDSSVSYTLFSGTLPPGTTLDANTGVLSGTANLTAGNSVTYNFTVSAVDAEQQNTERAFSLTIDVDSVTWTSPTDGNTVSIVVDQASTTTLSATSAAGDSITYTANALPAGLTLSGDTISGTANVVANTSVSLTATADTTTRSATIAVTFAVTLPLGDEYFNLTTLLLNGDTNTFITDASANAFAITPNGDTRPSAFSPYNGGWSNYFDGSGDYLRVSDASAFTFTADFTIEMWVKIQELKPSAIIASNNGAYDNTAVCLILDHPTAVDKISFWARSISTSAYTLTSDTVELNRWYHVAITRSGTTLKLFMDGVETDTAESSATVNLNYNGTNIGKYWGGDLKGYISNLRLIKGTAAYTSNFTPPTEPLTAITNTTLLTCQSNRLIDNSTNNFTITKNGDVKVLSFAPFTDTDTSTGSGYFDGTGDYLTVPDNTAFVVGSGNFTYEAWVYPTASPNQPVIAGQWDGAGGSTGLSWVLLLSNNSSRNLRFALSTNGSGVLVDQISSTPLPLNAWSHVAFVRNGDVFTVYLNGVAATNGSYTISAGASLFNATNALSIGASSPGTQPFQGYMANARFVVGSAIYTSNFTPPTEPLTAVSGTSLLTLQNRIGYNNSQPIDESGIKNVITRNGNAAVGSYSPYVPSGWSGYFDGTGDYLSLGTQVIPSSGDFTVEGWFNVDSYSARREIIFQCDAANAVDGRFFVYVTTSGKVVCFIGGTNRPGVLETTTTIQVGTWNHFAVVRNGNDYTVFINGVSEATGSGTGTIAAYNTLIARNSVTGVNTYWLGYLSNIRITTSAVYTGNFTPSTAPLEPIEGTSLLTLRGPSFTDDGPNRFAITRYGNTKIAPFSPFRPHTVAPDSHSVYFDGTTSSLNPPDGEAVLTPGDVDYTVEGWYMLTGAYKNYNNLWDWRTTGFQGGYQIRLTSAGYLQVTTSGTLWTDTENQLLPGVWYHVAFVKDAAVDEYYVYLNGTLIQTGSNSASATSGRLTIGANTGRTTYEWGGYISNFRITMSKVYTGNFTVPSSPLSTTQSSGTNISAISDPSTVAILTCQSPTVIDNSTNDFAITVNGNSQPTKFNPFGETVTTDVEYSPASHNGSVYFDGSGDYLIPAANSAYSFGTGAFTIEFWVYPTSTAAPQGVAGIGPASTGNQQIFYNLSSSGKIRYNVYDGSFVESSSIPLNTWSHVVIVREGTGTNQTKVYTNGVLSNSGTINNNFTDTNLVIGRTYYNLNQEYFGGYISNLRIIKGTALYTAAFVPPQAPVDPVPGTTLLTCDNNAAIQDKTGRNVLETVGNARVVNDVKKYGTGAMYFDGTGDYLLTPANLINNFPGDFTLECWLRFNVVGNGQIASAGPGNNTNAYYWQYYNSQLQFGIQNVGSVTATAWSPIAGVWYHLAVTRQGTSVKQFVDGVQLGSTGTTSVSFVDGPTYVGYAGAGYLNGYIDDLRITKGVARYTSNFTPPTAPFIAQ